jgi:hypothetical protein
MQIRYGEVLRVIYTDNNPNLLYGIEVKILNSDPISTKDPETSTSVITAKPLNINFKRMPIVGEIVALINAPTSYSSGLRNTTDIYYFDVVSAQSYTHHNAVPTVSRVTAQFTATGGDANQYQEAGSGNTNVPSTPKIDVNFTENTNVQPLQPYIGDVIIEGRYGNSIRFSTSPKAGTFTLNPKWNSGQASAPITIIRNTLQRTPPSKVNGFTTEDFNTDDSTIILSSGQELEFTTDSTTLSAAKSNQLTSWETERFGTTPQILATSGRIILNSRTKEIGLLSKAGIFLSTNTAVAIDAATKFAVESPKIELGNNATEPLILGNAFNSWMTQFITNLSTVTPIHPVVGPCLPLASTPQWPTIVSLLSQIPTILSQVAFTKKVAGVSSPNTVTIPKSDFTLTEQQVQEKTVQKEELRAVYEQDSLTPQEKSAVADKHNTTERELVNSQSINSSIEPVITPEIASETAKTINTVVYAGTVNEVDALPTPIDDIEEPEIEVDDTDYEYLENNNVDSTVDTFIETQLTEASKQKGVDVARIALQDVGITDLPIGSKTGPRVDVYLQNINCRPGRSEWGNGCIATWTKEAGLPLPTDNISSANGWYTWAKDTGRWSVTPMIGSIAVYGFKKPNGKFNCHSMGIVIEILEEGRILTVEGNVNSQVVQVEVNVNTILGFIIPSEESLDIPTVDYDEEVDYEKLEDARASAGPATATQKSLIRKVISATLSRGATSSRCARYTYNHALNWKRAVKNQSLYNGAAYAAGGNANSSVYHQNLVKLGWSFIRRANNVSKNELRKYINTNENFNVGDIICYWCLTDTSKSYGKYGHTQIYTAGYQDGARSNWSTDNNSNYNAGFVYGRSPENSKWQFVHLRAPSA